jgi:pyridoxamine 5'-phosphate oxidase family protein
MFSESELEYLKSQRLARIATVDSHGQPTVDAVGFSLDGEQILVGTHSPVLTRKYRNVLDGNTKVALIVDDLQSVQPWRPRGVKIHGVAEVVERAGHFGPGSYLVITPTVSWSWGIEPEESGGRGPKKTVWRSPK